jgi:conjugative relaxase-like TrwC/TraI family protein
MLSAAKLSSKGGSIHSYYSLDDYYSEGGDRSSQNNSSSPDGQSLEKESNHNSKAPSFWSGEIAEDLGLKGEVDGKILDDLTKGILPNGYVMQGKRNAQGEIIHDAGRDLTFSAPKSVSILAEVLGIEEIKAFHGEAVKSTLEHIEANYSFTRKKINGKTSKELTSQMLFAAYTHNTSRNLDPNLHTHCLALNITKRKEDDAYKTVFFDPIFDDYKHLGLIYRSNLAYNLQKKGFNIEVTDHEQGFFEIRGFPKAIIDRFSSRRQEIEKQVKEIGTLNSAKAKQIAALLTRDQKINLTNEILKEDWINVLKHELARLDKTIDLEKLDLKNLDQVFRKSLKNSWTDVIKENFSNFIEQKLSFILGKKEAAKNGQSNLKQSTSSLAKTAINSAITELSERKALFTEKELVDRALKHSLGKVNFDHITQEISRFKEKNLLVSALEIGHQNHLAARSSLRTELKIIDFAKESLRPENQRAPIYHQEELATITKEHNSYSGLNDGQKKAVDFILTNSSPVSAIQGYAGTGKTHMLKTAKELAELRNQSFFGLAASGTAVKELQSVNIEAKTLQWFLQKYQGVAAGRGTKQGMELMKSEFKDKILLIDESSLISSKQMEHLLTIAQRFNLKVNLIGDAKQLNAVEAGNPFYQLQKHGLNTVLMGEIVRQRNTRLKSAVYDVINASKHLDQGHIKRAFSKIDKITEISLEKTKEKAEQQTGKPTKIRSNDYFQKIENQFKLSNKIAKEAADSYCKLETKTRTETIILTLSNQSRSKVNDEIRKILKSNGELSPKDGITKEILVNKSLEEELKRNINSYSRGDILRFNKAQKNGKTNIARDLYYQVIDKDLKTNHLTLAELKENFTGNFTQGKKTTIWNPSQKSALEVYEKAQREFLIGEKINFTRGFISKGINNSLSATINSITSKAITISTEKDKNFEIKLSDDILKHIDYGYAFTANRAQGSTYNNVIAVLESYHSKLTSQKSFYVEISRARDHVHILLDNKHKIINRLEKETGEQISIIEAVKKKQNIAKTQAKEISVDKTTTSKPTKERKVKTKYLIPEFSNSEIQLRMKEAINQNFLKSDLRNLDQALHKAFSNIGQKAYFGAKKKGELIWHGKAGYVKDYKSGEYLSWGVGNIKLSETEKAKFTFKELTQEELLEIKKTEEQKRLKLENEKQLAEEKLSEFATRKYQSYPESNRQNAVNNQYLIKKGITEVIHNKDVKFSKNEIIIPLKDLDGKIHTLQSIAEDGKKRFLKSFMEGAGGKMGRVFIFNESNLGNSRNVIIAEGFATAASIDRAVNHGQPESQKIPIAVCFDAGNIEHSLKNIKERYPTHSFTIAADNDSLKNGHGRNVGEEKAIAAAKKYGAKVISPKFINQQQLHQTNKSSDFNDLHKIEGIEAVRKQFADKGNYKGFDAEVNLGKVHGHELGGMGEIGKYS